jgi:Secretion system C-terminal sorting domain
MKKIITLLVTISLTMSNLFGLLIYDPLMGVFDNTGSALCENLKLKYTLPDSLKTGYSYTVDIKKVIETNEMIVVYEFLPSKTSVFTTEIVSNLTNQFLPLIEFTQEKRYWNLAISVVVSDRITKLNKSLDPYATCKEITSECGEVRYVQKNIRYTSECGPSGKGYMLYPVVSEDTLKIIRESMPVPLVCFPTTFRVDSDVVVFKGLKNLNYKVFTEEVLYYVAYSSTKVDTVYSLDSTMTITPIGITPIDITPIIWYPSVSKYLSLIGSADLRACKEVGVDPNENKAYDLYPNPVSNELNILNFDGQIKLTNQVGRQFVIEGNQSFDVSSLPKGLYIVQFELNGQVQQEKLIIK